MWPFSLIIIFNHSYVYVRRRKYQTTIKWSVFKSHLSFSTQVTLVLDITPYIHKWKLNKISGFETLLNGALAFFSKISQGSQEMEE